MNRSKNYVPVNELTYGNLIEGIPRIPVSNNGVHYNPYKGKKKTFESFGRGPDGDTKAEEAQWEWLLKILEKYSWEVPDAIDTPDHYAINYSKYDNSPMLIAGFDHPTFGSISATLRFPVPDWRGVRSQEAFINLSAHQLAYIIAAKERTSGYVSHSSWGKTVQMDQYPNLASDFRTDPIGTAARLCLQSHSQVTPERFLEVINPPSFKDLQWLPAQTQGSPWTLSRNNADLWQNTEAIKQATFKGLGVLKRAVAAFEHLGVKISIETQEVGDSHVLSALHLYLPPGEEGSENELGHAIQINPEGISVTCGYVLDDEKYAALKMRHARKFLEEIQEYETTSFKIERPTQGEE